MEKAASVGMLLYDGEWKDLGTWTTLTDEIGVNALGNVSVGECENTYAINERGIPMVVLGTKDIVFI